MKIVEKCLTNLIKDEDFQFVVTRISEGLFQLWTSTYLPDFSSLGVQSRKKAFGTSIVDIFKFLTLDTYFSKDFGYFLEDEIGVQSWYIPSEIRVKKHYERSKIF